MTKGFKCRCVGGRTEATVRLSLSWISSGFRLPGVVEADEPCTALGCDGPTVPEAIAKARDHVSEDSGERAMRAERRAVGN